MNDNTPGKDCNLPSTPPAPNTVTAYAAYLVVRGKSLRKSETKRIIDGETPERLPNAVAAEVDVEAVLDGTFLNDALIELRGRSGILVAGDDPLSFEVVLLPTIRTEAEGLYDRIKAEFDGLEDPNKQVLVLSAKAIPITQDDKKTQRPFHLVKLAKVRAHIERTGIPLELPKVAEAQSTPATEVIR